MKLGAHLALGVLIQLLRSRAQYLRCGIAAQDLLHQLRASARRMETEQKVSVKTMKETIRSAGLATADLLEKRDIEARYAEALTRLDEAERLKSQPKKRRHIAEESSDDDDDGPMIPEPTGVEKSKVANKFSAYAHVDDEEPTGWLKSGSAKTATTAPRPLVP